MKSFLKFICEMPTISNIPSKPTSENENERKVSWDKVIDIMNQDAEQFGSTSLPKLEGYGVTASAGPQGIVHFVIHDDSGQPHGYLKMHNRGDHLQVSSMLRNPQIKNKLHSGIIHHVADHFQMPVVSDHQQTEGAVKYWNRVARAHGGVSLRQGGQEIPYNADMTSPENIWGQEFQHQDTLLAVNPRKAKS